MKLLKLGKQFRKSPVVEKTLSLENDNSEQGNIRAAW